MAYARNNIKDSNRQTCICCGLKINLLGDHKSIALFIGEASARRRGFRCMNCGQIACIVCSGNGCRCSCMGNAWIAQPYLDKTVDESARADKLEPKNLTAGKPGHD